MIRINNTQYFHFLQQADALRRSGSLCDAVISVKSQTFRAHRLVLACASKTLAQQLGQGDIDSPVHCTLEYFSPRTFQQVLDFTYTQALEVSVEDLHLLLRAAQQLEMRQLEDQCKKQLEALKCRTRDEDACRTVRDVKEGTESAGEKDQKQKESWVLENSFREMCPPEEKQSAPLPSHPLKNLSSPPSMKRKSRQSNMSATLRRRDSVISRPSTSSYSSPWTFSANMWDSVSTLRRIAENYSNLIAAHSRQPPNQPTVSQPSTQSTPYMIPLLRSHFQTPVQNSVIGHSGFHPCYSENLYAESMRMGSIIKQELLKRKRPSQRDYAGAIQTNEKSNLKLDHAERVQDSQHGSPDLPDDPAPQRSTQLGESCAGCHLCGRGDMQQHEAETRRDYRGEKPYQCKHCPKTFSLKHQLDTHHRVHTGEKPYECRLCGQRSRDYSAMIKHLRTHGGASPYQCTVCLEFCSSLIAMQRHVKTHAVQDFPPDWSISSTYLYISHI